MHSHAVVVYVVMHSVRKKLELNKKQTENKLFALFKLQPLAKRSCFEYLLDFSTKFRFHLETPTNPFPYIYCIVY